MILTIQKLISKIFRKEGKMKKLITVNVSLNFVNRSQRNNEINPNSSCGPTNMIQGLQYSGWVWNNDVFSELSQPEDKLTKFCRTDGETLSYFERKYKNLYDNWLKEAREIAEKNNKEIWEVETINAYSPNEIHDVMNFATNRFLGYSTEDISNGYGATSFLEGSKEQIITKILNDLQDGLPVVSSVRFGKYGHYVTIVGYTYYENKPYDDPVDIIIDNTYGKFNFETNKYEYVSGNDEYIPFEVFKGMIKPFGHFFKKGVETI